jgi:hypothetical protein
VAPQDLLELLEQAVQVVLRVLQVKPELLAHQVHLVLQVRQVLMVIDIDQQVQVLLI